MGRYETKNAFLTAGQAVCYLRAHLRPYMNKIIFRLAISTSALLSGFTVWAMDLELIQEPSCELLLGVTLRQASPPIWDLHSGWSNRGALGHLPARTTETEKIAGDQGIFWWGQSMGVAKSIEEARAHDFGHKYKNTGKVPYLITDIDVSDLNSQTPRDVVQFRLRKILESDAQIVEFEDAQKPNGKKISADNYVVLDKQKLINLMIMEKVFWFDLDARGARFHFYGWSFPKQRGIIEFSDALRVNDKGAIASGPIRKMMRTLIAFIKDGGSISFNTNFAEALEMAKNQWRTGPDGKTKVQNSRFKNDPENAAAAFKAYEAGRAISIEARNRNGELVAGEIVFRTGNVLKPNTIFHWVVGQDPRDPNRNYAEVAKAVSIAEAVRFGQRGIPWVDIGMVSPLSEEEGGKVVSGVEFAKRFEELNLLPEIDLHLNEAFALTELPFDMADIDTWLPTVQVPLAPKVRKELK